MAYINIIDWKCEQVTEWLKGIEIIISNSYLSAFANNFINGNKLLNIRPYELIELGITKIGHQESILEAIDNLKYFHFNLDRENLQFLALQVSTISTSLNRKLLRDANSKLSTDILTDVAITTSKVKVLISWLDRSPFKGVSQYSEIRTQMLRLSLELATIAQRDRFVQNPIQQIILISQKLSKLSNYIIQDISDSLVLQPAYLDLVTLKKKESELGFYIMPSYQFIHRVTNVKYNSPAHNSGKVEDGDEIVQINYQTVIGWQYKKVLLQLQDISSTDIILTLKKRPKHTSLYGQLMGLIKLPSKKRSLPYRFDNLPSPRVELINIPDLLITTTTTTTSKKEPKIEIIEESDESSGNESDLLTPTSVESQNKDHLYIPKPRAVLQRRHTICGEDLVNLQHIGNLVLWHERKPNKKESEATSMRDKSMSVSIGFGLEMTQRPTTLSTCIGIGQKLNENREVDCMYLRRKREITKANDTIQEQESENVEEDELLKSGVSKVVQFDTKIPQYAYDSKYICNVENTILESLVPIPYADEDILTDEKKSNDEGSKKTVEKNRHFYDVNSSNDLIEAVNVAVLKRVRLNKNLDITCIDSNSPPPTVEPRKQMRPIPPIPPRKQASVISNVDISEDIGGDVSMNINIQKTDGCVGARKKAFLEEPTERLSSEISELVMSTKTKTLTNKKKNSLLAKRRKVSLKLLENNATIQGHLYRRAKDKSEVAYWIKLYFVLIDSSLYGFKIKESSKADCVVYLSGFTVSTAKEVHSKANSFKVYHPKKTFYMAAETETAMNQWMEYIKQATLKGVTNLECDAKELYSETECSDEEDSNVQLSRNNSQMSTSLPLAQSPSSPSHSHSSKHHYHLNFGSLKKTFARSYNTANESNSSASNDNKFLGGLFSTNKSEKKGNDIIIPTAQFKTYRKVQKEGGLQLGATSMINSNISDLYLSASTFETQSFLTKLSTDTKDDHQNNSDNIQKTNSSKDDEEISLKKYKQTIRKPHNFLHASNPNLLEYNSYQVNTDFPTSCHAQLSSSSSSTNAWDHQITGQMTLLDLMLQQREEESKDMYTKRVDQGLEQGFERNDEKFIVTKKLTKKAPDPHIEKIQKRSLPNTPDYVLNFKLDDRAILYARSKEGLKLRDFGYELISNDDDSQQNSSKALESKSSQENNKMWPSKRKIVPLSGSVKKKSGLGWMSSQEESKANTQDLQASSSSKVAYFSKLSFANSNVKEKKLLGSPKLHRVIFGNRQQATSNDDEIFSSITFPKHPPSSQTDAKPTDLQLPPTFKPETYSLNFLKNSTND